MMTKELLQELFCYRDDGELVYRMDVGRTKAGSTTGKNIGADGYRRITIKRRNFKLHRAIFLLHHGWLPKLVDHINQNKADCRIENLRAASASQNTAYKPKFRTGHSKYKGVSKKRNKWQATIVKDYKHIHLGNFECQLVAAFAYDKKAKEIYGEFAWTNF